MEESFDTEPLVGRNWDRGTIVTRGSDLKTDVMSVGLEEELELVGKVKCEEAPVSHGSQVNANAY